jgi:hypothetical protein
MTTHTPAPWKVHETELTLDVRADDQFLTVAQRFWASIGTGAEAVAEARADARLIAAAPDLLAVAKAFVEMYAGLDDAIGPTVNAKVRAARAAVAKAEGGVQ